MTRATAERFFVLRSFSSMIPLISAAIAAIGPVLRSGTRTEKFPRLTSRRTESRRSASWAEMPWPARPTGSGDPDPFVPLPPLPEGWRPTDSIWARRRGLASGTIHLYTKAGCESQTIHAIRANRDRGSLPVRPGLPNLTAPPIPVLRYVAGPPAKLIPSLRICFGLPGLKNSFSLRSPRAIFIILFDVLDG